MTIEHPEFVASQIDVDPELKTSVQALKPGCELSLSAQDANGELTLNFGILMAGRGLPQSGSLPTSRESDLARSQTASGRRCLSVLKKMGELALVESYLFDCEHRRARKFVGFP